MKQNYKINFLHYVCEFELDDSKTLSLEGSKEFSFKITDKNNTNNYVTIYYEDFKTENWKNIMEQLNYSDEKEFSANMKKLSFKIMELYGNQKVNSDLGHNFKIYPSNEIDIDDVGKYF